MRVLEKTKFALVSKILTVLLFLMGFTIRAPQAAARVDAIKAQGLSPSEVSASENLRSGSAVRARKGNEARVSPPPGDIWQGWPGSSMVGSPFVLPSVPGVAKGRFSFTSPGAERQNGIGGRGGGNLVASSESIRPVLVDYFAYLPGLRDFQAPRGALPLVITNLKSLAGADVPYVRMSEQPAFEITRWRLRTWAASSPVVVGAIMESIKFMDFFPVDSPIQAQPGYRILFPAKENSTFKIVPVIGYSKDLGGAVISIPIWNQIGVMTQAGLPVHEALRDIQITLADGMSDEVLQWVTAKIMLTDPIEGETLDKSEYFGDYLGRLIRETKEEPMATKLRTCSVIKKLSRISKSCVDSLRSFALACASKNLSEIHEDFRMHREQILDCSQTLSGTQGILVAENTLHSLQDSIWALSRTKLVSSRSILQMSTRLKYLLSLPELEN